MTETHSVEDKSAQPVSKRAGGDDNQLGEDQMLTADFVDGYQPLPLLEIKALLSDKSVNCIRPMLLT